MKNKIALAVSTALMTVTLSSAAYVESVRQSIPLASGKTNTSADTNISIGKLTKKFYPEENLAEGQYTYIIRLKDMPLATYDGSIQGLAATNPKIAKKELFTKLTASTLSSAQIRKELRLDLSSKAAVEYSNFLANKQQSFLSQASEKLGNQLDVVYNYKNAFNGMAVRLTQRQAATLATLNSVAFIERERMEHVDTDTGPIHIGATQVWSGEGQSAVNMGEGVIIGTIDTGINSDHPSFADIGGDGYDHTNPWGEGVYVGDCAGDFASMCNDKLIGIHSYASITDNYDDSEVFGATPPMKNGEDYNGHGSHTASTSGGNILRSVPLVTGENGVTESDGIINESFSFEQISGVAPHANIIAYQICNPGEQGDRYSGCAGAAIVAALDDAVADGVDVINYSISGGGDPWRSAIELGFLAAQEAGIFAAVSAGNDGPDAETTDKSAPWYTAVGASTHGRTLDTHVNFNEKEYIFINGTGPVIDTAIVATPIAAIDIDANNSEGCNAFAADAFKDSIALISRGACAFSDKVNNATTAGATSVVVYNNRDGDSAIVMGSLEATTIPAVMISQNDGVALLADLVNNTTMTLTIDPAITLNVGQSDDMASFSSRGPNKNVNNIMTPSVTAPGVSVYAAFADQHFGHENSGPSPSDFNFLSGTSMSSPHTAGSGAVLKSAHPTWTADNIRSALMLTATTDVRKEDGQTPADVFDMGSGSIRVNRATNTGLVMDETFANYIKADPSVDGKPETLNIPSMANTQCIGTCSWERTFTATKDASWSVTSNTPESSVMTLTVTPTSFDISAGETQTITVTADVSEAEAGVWNFGDITLSAADTPDARLPVLVQVDDNNLPSSLSVTASRKSGSFTFTNLKSSALENVSAGVFDKMSNLIEPQTVNVPDGDFDFIVVTFDEIVPNVVFSTSSATAPDVDLRILDSTFARIGASAGVDSNESVAFVNLPAGTYFIVVDSFTASSEGATDEVIITTTSILTDDASKNDNVTVSITENDDSFDLTFQWTDNTPGSSILALVSGDDSSEIQIPFNLLLGEDDVQEILTDELTAGSTEMEPGVAQPISFNIAPNFTNVDKVYTLTAQVSGREEITNPTNEGIISGNTITWTITRAVGVSSDVLSVGFDLIPRAAGVSSEITLSDTLDNDTVTSTYNFGAADVAPVIIITAPSSVTEDDSFTIDASSSSDANGDELSYTWIQLSGTPVSFSANTAVLNLVAPGVSNDETIAFQLTIDDGKGNTDTATTSVSILNRPSSGGSFGWLILLLTPMLFARRRKV